MLSVQPLGAHTLVAVELAGHRLWAKLPAGQERAAGARAGLGAAAPRAPADLRARPGPAGGVKPVTSAPGCWSSRRLSVAFSAVLPLMTVVNYSVQDILGPEQKVYVGIEWFRQVLRDADLHAALGRQLLFSAGPWPSRSRWGSPSPWPCQLAAGGPRLALVALAMPLLIPWNVVGTIWQIFAREDIGLLGRLLNRLLVYNYTQDPTDAWLTVLLMDVWHWTPLPRCWPTPACAPSPRPTTRPRASTGASRWAVFRHIQLPKLRSVLMIAVLLRFMDSFMIYTEPFVLTGGGPGNATTFLSQYLTQKAVGQFDLGPAAAFSIVYFLIILLLCFVLYNFMREVGTRDPAGRAPP